MGKCGNIKQCKYVSQRWKKKYEAISLGRCRESKTSWMLLPNSTWVCLAFESLLVKLFLPGFVEDKEVWERKKAAIVDKFLSELQDFQNKSGYFAR
jgi:hypothetical protein